MIGNEFEQGKKLQSVTSVMEAQSNELAFDSLVMALIYQNFGYIGRFDFRELTRILENMREGKRVVGSSLLMALSILGEVGLGIYHKEVQANPIIELTDLGRASLEAYKVYEHELAGPYIDYGVAMLQVVISEPDARKMAEEMLFRDSSPYHKAGLGFYRFAPIHRILSVQSANLKLGTLFGLSKVVRPPDSLAVLGEVKQEDVLDGLRQCDLVQVEEDGVEITSLGEASLRAFNAYYGVMESLL